MMGVGEIAHVMPASLAYGKAKMPIFYLAAIKEGIKHRPSQFSIQIMGYKFGCKNPKWNETRATNFVFSKLKTT